MTLLIISKVESLDIEFYVIICVISYENRNFQLLIEISVKIRSSRIYFIDSKYAQSDQISTVGSPHLNNQKKGSSEGKQQINNNSDAISFSVI